MEALNKFEVKKLPENKNDKHNLGDILKFIRGSI